MGRMGPMLGLRGDWVWGRVFISTGVHFRFGGVAGRSLSVAARNGCLLIEDFFGQVGEDFEFDFAGGLAVFV